MALLGFGGFATLFFGWLALRSVVRCDVNIKTKPGKFCRNDITGVSFGCGAHYWHKPVAWSRYLGAGVIERVIPIKLPILRWQAQKQTGRICETELVTSGAAPTALERPAASEDARAKDDKSLSPRVQAISVYSTIAGGLTTVAAFAFTVILAAAH